MINPWFRFLEEQKTIESMKSMSFVRKKLTNSRRIFHSNLLRHTFKKKLFVVVYIFENYMLSIRFNIM